MIRLALAAALCCLLGASSSTHAGDDWTLVWSDEFDGISLDLTKWTPQIGTGCPNLCGWGNNELQYYRAQNATVGDGHLTIEARRESYGGSAYTSARLRTRNLADFRYGRFEMRAKLPTGQGLWPAFWMLPTDEAYGGWASSGEIDIMEALGHQPTTVHGTIHYGGGWPANTHSSHSTTSATPLHESFHVFALEWEETEMRWFLDDQLFATQTYWRSDGNPFPAPFDQPFHMLLNVAVGGNWPGNPDGSTTFPQRLIVDYVRVYQAGQGCSSTYDSMDHADPFNNGWFAFDGSVGGGGINAETVDLPPLPNERASVATGWGSGGASGFVGGFGRSRSMDLDGFTHFEFWIRPDAGQDYDLEINLQDDDDGNEIIANPPDGNDDEFQAIVRVRSDGSGDALAGGGWQKISVPLSAFVDDNSYHWGGNGIFDPIGIARGGNGMMKNIVIAVIAVSGSNATFRTDQWAFVQNTASIGGRIWSDDDRDGLADVGESGRAGVQVELDDAKTGATLTSTITTTDGSYDFEGVPGGEYTVRVATGTLPSGIEPTYDPDGLASLHSFTRVVDCGETTAGNDFGYGPVATGTVATPRARDTFHPVSPNPFNARTVLRFELAGESLTELTIFDAHGRRVATVESSNLSDGPHERVWMGRDDRGLPVASGVYFAVLRTERARISHRMVLVE